MALDSVLNENYLISLFNISILQLLSEIKRLKYI